MSERIHEIHGIAGLKSTNIYSEDTRQVTVENRLDCVVLVIGIPGERKAVSMTPSQAKIISSQLIDAAARVEGGESESS